jgi:hypothetical protein
MTTKASSPVGKEDISVIRKIGSIKQEICRERDEAGGPASDSCMNFVDAFLGNVRSFRMHESPESRQRKEQKLNELMAICRAGKSDHQTLQRAVMEIPQLVLEPDPDAVKALAVLLHHENKYVRVCACIALGRLGGKEASGKLKELAQSGDPEMRTIAERALHQWEIRQSLRELEGQRLRSMEKLIKENRQLYAMLAPGFGAKYGFVLAGLGLLTSIVLWQGWRYFDIKIIHPVLCLVGATSCVILFCMAMIRYKKEKEKWV